MELFSIALIYSLCLYGMAMMFIQFNGPFDIIEYFRKVVHWFHPKLGELFTCFFCLSTWIGAFVSLINYFFVPIAFTPFNIILGETHIWWLIMILDTFFACASVWLWHVLDDYIESNTKVEYEDE